MFRSSQVYDERNTILFIGCNPRDIQVSEAIPEMRLTILIADNIHYAYKPALAGDVLIKQKRKADRLGEPQPLAGMQVDKKNIVMAEVLQE